MSTFRKKYSIGKMYGRLQSDEFEEIELDKMKNNLRFVFSMDINSGRDTLVEPSIFILNFGNSSSSIELY